MHAPGKHCCTPPLFSPGVHTALPSHITQTPAAWAGSPCWARMLPVFIGEVLQPSDHLCGLLWTLSNSSLSFLYWGSHTWTQYCRWGLMRAEQRGTITSLSLLATPLMMDKSFVHSYWGKQTEKHFLFYSATNNIRNSTRKGRF